MFRSSSPQSFPRKKWSKLHVICENALSPENIDVSFVYKQSLPEKHGNVKRIEVKGIQLNIGLKSLSSNTNDKVTKLKFSCEPHSESCDETEHYLRPQVGSVDDSRAIEKRETNLHADSKLTVNEGDNGSATQWVSQATVANSRKNSAAESQSFKLIENVHKFQIVNISNEEWKAMIKNRSNHGFTSDEHRYILLKKLRSVYGGCVPCVRNHYLRHPGDRYIDRSIWRY